MSFTRRPSDTFPSVFPTYLLPSIPFRRKSRQSSTDSNDSTTSTISTDSVSPSSSNPFIRSLTPMPISSASSTVIAPDDKFLSGHTSRLHCARCSTDLCLTSQIISKGFTGRHGKAYLVQGTPSHIHTNAPTGAGLPNTYQNKAVPRNLVTGQHVVSDVSCSICGTGLGWKYVEAAEESQKYKVGKYILETMRIRVGVEWDNDEVQGGEQGYDEVLPLPPNELRKLNDGASGSGQEVEFDSQDEDECEDLFAGVWSPQLALRRRHRRKERYSRKQMAARIASRSDDTLS